MASTWHIHIKGQVQGVGFRPFVYQQAQEFGVNGWVNNTINGVHCEFNASGERAQKFFESLISHAPDLAQITGHNLRATESKWYDDFRIIHSREEGQANLLLAPDFAMCDDCRREVFDMQNRRHGYPFITCTNCGPRYSIIEKLPYDRERTTMEKFPMCKPCKTEYENPLDRRYYSQTNSCAVCGVSMSFYDKDRQLVASATHAIITKISAAWGEGKIVAIKGIGGYLLTCDATNPAVIRTLRECKHRPAKPFALMYPDVAMLGNDVVLIEEARKMLTNAVSPIVLADAKCQTADEKRHPKSDIQHPASSIQHQPTGIQHSTLNIQHSTSGICLPEIAPGLSRLGVMIPYTPLYALLLKEFDRPIIATSGNISGSPIVFDDEKALNELTQIADYVLTNNRDIVVPQDDSVVTFSSSHHQKIIYRRSRGWAPSYINPELRLPEQTILAAGAMLKSTFTYLHRQNVFISQYLGDLDHFDTQQNYRLVTEHFFRLFDEQPQLILADNHPDYFSTRFASHLADDLDIHIKKYQHHKAHFAAVLGEHGLLDSQEAILGVIWDGTGLGDDGQVWGGEFFRYENHHFTRHSHFDYFDFILGDKMPREPRISALSATHNVEGADEVMQEKFTALEWKNYHTLLQKPDNLQTSSVGRLFDAVSSLLGLKDRQTFEGEAAMRLETLARNYVERNGHQLDKRYGSEASGKNGSTQSLLEGILEDLQQGVTPEIIAARFHHSLVEIIAVKAEQQGVKKIAFSGGVFQNGLLVDLIIDRLGDACELYFHQQLSPNDENISFGQLMCYVLESGDQF